LYGRRWATSALALEEADERRAQYLREGGVLIVITTSLHVRTPQPPSQGLLIAS
jgi:hypothetical protein